jgi:hypothetical protein
MLFNSLLDLHELKVFGSLAYASTLHVNKTKLSPKGRKCVYLGYKQGVKGKILFDLHTKEIFISRNVTHHDHILPYITESTRPKWQYYTFSPHTPASDTTILTDNSLPTTLDNDHTPTPVDQTNSDTPAANPPIPSHSRPDRVRHKPSYLSEFMCNSLDSSSQSSSSGTLYQSLLTILLLNCLIHIMSSHCLSDNTQNLSLMLKLVSQNIGYIL